MILDAALALFAARGVTSTSVDDIALKAGIAKGSIYYNFGSKDNLVHELIERHATRLGQALAQAPRSPGARGRREILGTLLREIADHPDVAQLMVSEMFRTDRAWLEIVATWRYVMTEPLERNLLAEVGPDCAARCSLQASAFVGATLTAGLDWLLTHPDLSVDDVLDILSDMPPIAGRESFT